MGAAPLQQMCSSGEMCSSMSKIPQGSAGPPRPTLANKCFEVRRALEPPRRVVARRVGHGVECGQATAFEATPEARPRHAVRCREGHEMGAKLSREMLQFMRCDGESACDHCERELSDHVAHYRCKACDLNYCLSCSREQLGLSSAAAAPDNGEAAYPVLSLGPGDILLVGPDRFNIHHVVLVRGPLRRVPELAEFINPPPGAELLACETIESTQGVTGVNAWWYSTLTILQRDPHAGGSAFVVADMPQDGSNTLCQVTEPVPCKVLLHPCRPEGGGAELDAAAFEDALQQCAGRSQQYSWKTAVKAFLTYQTMMHAEDYPTQEDRSMLIQQVYWSWTKPPICSAVAIKVWQNYLVTKHEDDVDQAAQAILSCMPVWCHLTTPSAMVKALTLCGWELYESLDA